MKDKTIANLFIGAFAICVLGALAEGSNQNALFSIGGIGLLVLSAMSVVRMYKNNKQDWLPYALGTTEGLAIILYVLTNDIPEVLALAFWVFGVWAIIRLYKAV